jgi:hypothetical protein
LADNCLKADESLKSFLFTLENPHRVAARRFALKAEAKDRAINCDATRGPSFGSMNPLAFFLRSGGDISVSSDCNANTRSSTCLDFVYTNDTGLDGDRVFAGARYFKVKEIEVFEITD